MSGRRCNYFLTISDYSAMIRKTDLEFWIRNGSKIRVIELDDIIGRFIWNISQGYGNFKLVYDIYTG